MKRAVAKKKHCGSIREALRGINDCLAPLLLSLRCTQPSNRLIQFRGEIAAGASQRFCHGLDHASAHGGEPFFEDSFDLVARGIARIRERSACQVFHVMPGSNSILSDKKPCDYSLMKNLARRRRFRVDG